MTRSQTARIARALAFALLDGDWTAPGLIRRGGIVLGHKRPSLRSLVRAVLRAYPRPPWDRPRELTAWLLQSRAWPKALDDAPGVFPVRWLPFQPAMGDMPWPVPAIPTAGELAHFLEMTVSELEWFADVRSLERRATDERLRHYRYRWVPKSDGGLRLIESPKARLREAQRHLLGAILNRIPPHAGAHGFVRGRSALTFASEHVGARVVLRFDLQDFFGSIGAGRIYGVFRSAGYPEAVAHTLTGLTTNALPLGVWQDAPRSAGSATALNEHFMLGRRLAQPHVPQGAPTSPALANLCAHGLDRRLSGLADGFGLRYTRYADDLALSGSLKRPVATRLVELAQSIAAEEGFTIRERKTLIMGQGQRQHLAGVVVNSRPNLDRRAYDRLRAVLHNCARNGLEAENRDLHPRFAEHLAGRVSWAVSLNPRRARTLQPLLSAATAPPEPA